MRAGARVDQGVGGVLPRAGVRGGVSNGAGEKMQHCAGATVPHGSGGTM